MALKNPPVVNVQMLIRRPVAEVFDAFVDPAVTTQFWFTKSSGRLEAGKQVTWEWEMYGVSAQVRVKDVQENTRILIEWDDPPQPVEWVFSAQAEDSTLVSITTQGFSGTEDEIVAGAIDSKGGFALVLAGAKALLEHNVRLNLVADQHPEAHKKGGA